MAPDTVVERQVLGGIPIEWNKGALAPGCLADLVVLGGDLLATPAARIKDIPVELTVTWVFDAGTVT